MRLARAGDGLVSGQGDVFGATYFEDNPVPGEIIETGVEIITPLLYDANHEDNPELIGVFPQTPVILQVD